MHFDRKSVQRMYLGSLEIMIKKASCLVMSMSYEASESAESAAVSTVWICRDLRSAICARLSARRTAARWSHLWAQYPANPKVPMAMRWPSGLDSKGRFSIPS